MRFGKWFLSACGILGLILSVGVAQEFSLGENNTSTARPGVAQSGSSVPSRFYSRHGVDRTVDDIVGKARQTGSVTPAEAQALPAAKPVATPSRYTRSRRFPFEDRKPVSGGKVGERKQKQGYLDKLFRGAVPSSVRKSPSSSTPDIPNLDKAPHPLRRTAAASGQGGVREVPLPRELPIAEPTEDELLNDSPNRLRFADFEIDTDEPTQGRIIQAGATIENISPFSAPGEDVGEPSPPEFNRLPLLEPDAEDVKPAEADPGKTTVSLPPRPTTVRVAASVSGPQTAKITIQWVKKSDINVGQECQCQLLLTNTGVVAAKNVLVDAYFPTSVRLVKTEPAPATVTDHLTWKFTELTPGQKQVIDIRMIPNERGELDTSAFVTFTSAANSVFTVSEPLLMVKVDGPKEVLVGDPASQVIRVSNPGTGVATNVKLEAIIPAGLEHLRGERLAMEIGSLNPGETRTVRIALASVGGGEQELNVQVVADGGLRKNESKTIDVIASSLNAKLSGPATRFVGRTAQYTVTVINESDVASNNVRAVYKAPEGFKFVRADNGGRRDQARRTVSWFIGSLEPGDSVKRSVFLTAVSTGDFTHSAAVTSEHGASASAELATTIDATANLVLQIVERADLVKVGAETAFEVRVRNDGGKPAMNVSLSIELPAGVKYQSARGPSELLAQNGLLLFKSIGQLDPGKTAIYRVYVQGSAVGNHRLRARVASDSVGEPIIIEELTKFEAE
jgi:uncharacterized repeat protein (TIGR01451 family)